MVTIEKVYEQYIKPLAATEQLRLVAIITQHLSNQPSIVESSPKKRLKHNIMELHGLGTAIWQEIDAQQYVNHLREEWDSRPLY